jgi:hypothetical protein
MAGLLGPNLGEQADADMSVEPLFRGGQNARLDLRRA